jgi:hypothetical protein
MTIMNRNRRFCAITVWCFLAGILLFLNCAFPSDGGGSRGGNPIVTGRVINPDGTNASHTQVQLFPESHDPIKDKALPGNSTDTTDENGTFSLQTAGPGNYNVQAVHIFNRTRLLVQDITVKKDAVDIDADTLRKSGSIIVPISNGFDTASGYVYVPGTNIAVSLSGKSNYVILDSVPAGITLKVEYAAKNSTEIPKVINDSVYVLPSDTAKIQYAEWKYSQKIILNTSQSGANVSVDVYGFPVLIRLKAPVFDFSQAAGNGEDVRFTKADGTQLPYEIERWDSPNGRAEIWVKVDTIHGANSTQTITMYWGNINAKGQSSSTAVFDTTEGFVGVWHLSSYDDATANRHNGTNSGAVDSTGMIGPAKGFNGNEGIKITGLLGQPQSITLSAWARLDTVQNWGSEVISLGNAVLLRMDQTKTPAGGIKGSFHVNSDTIWYDLISDTYLQKTGWHYLSFAIDGVNHTQTLLIDGIVYSYRTLQTPIFYSGMGADTWIGRHGNKELNWFFNGIIDEVRVSRIANSNDWSKLCFMNQKTNDALVIFK